MTERLPIYVIYDHPKDYPDHYVIKRDLVDTNVYRDPGYIFKHENLEVCRREMVMKGLVCLQRHQNDDPVIIETWL